MMYDEHITDFYIKKYTDKSASVVKGSEWIDYHGEKYIVIKRDNNEVRYTSKTFGWETSMSVGSFLHTMKEML